MSTPVSLLSLVSDSMTRASEPPPGQAGSNAPHPPPALAREGDHFDFSMPSLEPPPSYAPPSSTFDDDLAAISRLLGGDTEAMKKFMMVLDMLRRVSPQAARALLRSVRTGLEGFRASSQQQTAGAAGTTGTAHAARASVSMVRLQIDIQYERQTSETRSDASGTVSQQSVERARISIRFQSMSASSSGDTQTADPIVLDLNGDGITAKGLAQGERFDINADGRADWTSFAGLGDGLLAYDRNGDGKINDGRELFGDQRGAENGFEELRKLDSNQDGRIDSRDSAYRSLAVLSDGNADGRTDHLVSLAAAGIQSISLDYARVADLINPDAKVVQRGTFTRADGSKGEAADLSLRFQPA